MKKTFTFILSAICALFVFVSCENLISEGGDDESTNNNNNNNQSTDVAYYLDNIEADGVTITNYKYNSDKSISQATMYIENSVENEDGSYEDRTFVMSYDYSTANKISINYTIEGADNQVPETMLSCTLNSAGYAQSLTCYKIICVSAVLMDSEDVANEDYYDLVYNFTYDSDGYMSGYTYYYYHSETGAKEESYGGGSRSFSWANGDLKSITQNGLTTTQTYGNSPMPQTSNLEISAVYMYLWPDDEDISSQVFFLYETNLFGKRAANISTNNFTVNQDSRGLVTNLTIASHVMSFEYNE